ncbi:MAG: FG-GAP repeat protein, partial [Phycisphaerales bacterium]
FGGSVAVSGDVAVIGARGDDDNGTNSGSAYVFRMVGSTWVQEQKLLADDGDALDYFGGSVAVSGDVALVGAHGDDDNGSHSGSAYVFLYNGSGWVQQQKLLANDGTSDDRFGASVAVSSQLAVIGAFWDDDNGHASGSAYVFRNIGSSWFQDQKLLADDGELGDQFGYAAAVSGAVAVIGAYLDDDNGSQSGSAYVFAVPSPDCNENGIPDECDIAERTSEDCQPNGIPDECDIVAGTSLDCNGNGVPDQCDVAEGTSLDCNINGTPDECEAAADIKPGACPNPFNRIGHGVLPVALLGASHFDVTQIDAATVRLARADGQGQPVAPHEGPPGPHSVYEDVATPFCGELCDCHDAAGDGILDLFMKFKSDHVVAGLLLDELDPGALVELVVTGSLLDGTPFAAGDCIRLVPPGTPPGELVVTSSMPNVWVDSSPLDLQLDGGGFTDFQRTYPAGTVVTLTAPDSVNGRHFKRWVVDGVLQPAGVKTIELTIVDGLMSVELELKWSPPNIPPRENLGPDRLMEP